eukprot:TRINITY_DN10141_c0_g1_i1.p1 TRINITY_DN10141_c0_g1~~TRINITY_DN10141_c0_g1_i1.p1  ORF type:complete len:397 (+),score=82.91 TRINITY_DN10141_c0_g1_i1:926-2116(+)
MSVPIPTLGDDVFGDQVLLQDLSTPKQDQGQQYTQDDDNKGEAVDPTSASLAVEDNGAVLRPITDFVNEIDPHYRTVYDVVSGWDGHDFPIRSRLSSPTGRHLLDTFGDSLRHVNGLFDAAYGIQARKVPAHMPHFIERDVMKSLQAKYAKEYDITSSHHFRQGDDMQFAFAYFYYMMSEPPPFDPEGLWAELDRDQDDKLNLNELRTLVVNLFPGRTRTPGLITETTKNMTVMLNNASSTDGVTFNQLMDHRPTLAKLKDMYKKRSARRYELEPLDEVHFMQVRDNHDTVLEQLDSIRKNKPKFICLNDNMNATHPNPKVVQAIQDIYQSLFPLPSEFERKDGQANKWLYMVDYRRDMANMERRKRQTMVALISVIVFALCACLVWCCRSDRIDQ